MRHETGSLLGVGGVTLFTRTWRPEERPRGRVLLSHGYAEHSGRYAHVAERLVRAGLAVTAVDHRGHGRSGGDRATVRDFGLFAADLRIVHEAMQDAAPDEADLPVVLLGHSMGSAIALDYLLGTPLPVRLLVLSGTFLRTPEATPEPVRRLAPLLGRIAPRLQVQPLDANLISRDPAVVAAYRADPLVYTGKVQAATGAALLTLPDRVIPRAGAITLPTLLVHGGADGLADVEAARELERALGGDDVTLKVYEGLYHEVFNEPEQDRVLDDVVGWIEERL